MSAHVVEPAALPSRRVRRLEKRMCILREHLILMPAQVAQHRGQRHAMLDIPACQIDLELLAGTHG